MSEPTTDRGPDARKPGPWGALFRVVTEPTAAFQAVAERPALFPPYLLQMATYVIGSLLILPLTMSAVTEQMAKTSGVPPVAIQAAKISVIIFGPVSAIAAPWLIGALLALIASFFAQFQGGSVGFRSYLSIIGYARVPLAVGYLVQSALMSTAPTLQQAQSTSLSLAVLAPDGTNYVLKAFLSTLNPFDLCYYGLLAIGFASLQRIKPAKSAALVGTIYVLTFLLMLAGTAFNKSRGM